MNFNPTIKSKLSGLKTKNAALIRLVLGICNKRLHSSGHVGANFVAVFVAFTSYELWQSLLTIQIIG
jgi:hypothetical protein